MKFIHPARRIAPILLKQRRLARISLIRRPPHTARAADLD
jgi:hypothetical protein